MPNSAWTVRETTQIFVISASIYIASAGDSDCSTGRISAAVVGESLCERALEGAIAVELCSCSIRGTVRQRRFLFSRRVCSRGSGERNERERKK